MKRRYRKRGREALVRPLHPCMFNNNNPITGDPWLSPECSRAFWRTSCTKRQGLRRLGRGFVRLRTGRDDEVQEAYYTIGQEMPRSRYSTKRVSGKPGEIHLDPKDRETQPDERVVVEYEPFLLEPVQTDKESVGSLKARFRRQE